MIWALLIFLSAPARADFFLPPSFYGFDPNDAFEVQSYRRYDSETESDFLTYKPISCHNQYVMRGSPSGLCSSLGSLGSKRFLVDHFFIFSHRINKDVVFRAHWVKDQAYTDNINAQAAEFLYTPSPHHAIGLQGQFDSNKAADDLGVSYNFLISDVQGRFELNAFDFSRNERNEDSDRFDRNPYSGSLQLLKRDGGRIYHLQTQIEPQWVWDRPAFGDVVKRKRSDTHIFIQHFDHLFTLQYARSDLEINSTFQKESVLRGHWQMQLNDEWQLGIRSTQKTWRTGDGSLTHQDFLPFTWYQSKEHLRNWRFGYEFTLHQAFGRLRKPEDTASIVEHRLNTSWSIFKTNQARLDLLLTFDLDEFGSEETWEGGNGQFTLEF